MNLNIDSHEVIMPDLDLQEGNHGNAESYEMIFNENPFTPRLSAFE